MKSNEIRFYRLRKGITQGDLATAIGVSQQAVAKWETQLTSVSDELVPKIEKALGVRKEILFPELRAQIHYKQKQTEILNEKMDLILPYEIVINFKTTRGSYCSNISKETYIRISRQLDDQDMKIIWLESLEGMIVAANKDQISSIEMGYDLGTLPDRIIERQELGNIDPDFEKSGDDRLIRLFVDGYKVPFSEIPAADEDHNNLMRVLSSALDDYLHLDAFFSFEYDTGNDVRSFHLRPERFELIEGPLKIYKKFVDYLCLIDGVLDSDTAKAKSATGSAKNTSTPKAQKMTKKND
jgi:transcriptional regulator with XRE-family HTH domain